MTTYLEYYKKSGLKGQTKLNELTIWAVNKLLDNKSNIIGSGAFLKERQDQLIKDMLYEGWRTADKRFRTAVYRWIRNHSDVYETDPSDLLLRGL